MYRIEFAPLNFYSNILSDECLCLGILFHNITNNKRDFRFISNFRRFQSFNDEVDPAFVKSYLSGIKEEIENNLFDNEEFCLSDYTKIFVNEMRFSKPRQMDFDEKEDYIDILSKIYMKFDVKKDKRLNSDEEKIYIKRILLQSNIELLPPNIKGQFEEDIKFDYLSNKFAIKLFSFKDKDMKRMIPTAKQWSFTANELKNKYQVVFIYDQCEIQEQEPEANIVLNILKENAKVCEKSAGLEYITQ